MRQGFHIASGAGRLVAIDMDSVERTEYIIHQSVGSDRRFYHNVEFYDFDSDGYRDIVTVRSGFFINGPFSPPVGELVWFKNPGEELNPLIEWEETVLVGGFEPDIEIDMADLDGDGIPEFVTTHFFSSGPSYDTGRIVLYGAPAGKDWSAVPSNPVRLNELVTNEQGKPFSVEFVDLDGDGDLDILATNHQPDNAVAISTTPGRVFALENPGGDAFSNDWVVHILLNNLRPNLSLPNATSSRLAPGFSIPFYPCHADHPWIVVGGDQASKVWLMKPVANQDFAYDSVVIFDINDTYGEGTTQTPLFPGSTIAISTIGKLQTQPSEEEDGAVLIYIPVFEAGDIYVIRLSCSECDSSDESSE